MPSNGMKTHAINTLSNLDFSKVFRCCCEHQQNFIRAKLWNEISCPIQVCHIVFFFVPTNCAKAQSTKCFEWAKYIGSFRWCLASLKILPNILYVHSAHHVYDTTSLRFNFFSIWLLFANFPSMFIQNLLKFNWVWKGTLHTEQCWTLNAKWTHCRDSLAKWKWSDSGKVSINNMHKHFHAWKIIKKKFKLVQWQFANGINKTI